jgi:hypothetical protein
MGNNPTTAMTISATASASDSAVQQMDVMIEDVHSRAAQMDEEISQVRDRCKGLATAATKEAESIVSYFLRWDWASPYEGGLTMHSQVKGSQPRTISWCFLRSSDFYQIS